MKINTHTASCYALTPLTWSGLHRESRRSFAAILPRRRVRRAKVEKKQENIKQNNCPRKDRVGNKSEVRFRDYICLICFAASL